MQLGSIMMGSGVLKLCQLAARESWQVSLERRQAELYAAKEKGRSDTYARAKKVEKCEKVIGWIQSQIQ